MAVGSMLKRGFSPDILTYTALVKGLCVEDRIFEAIRLFKKISKLGCQPNVVTFGTLINRLCRSRNAAFVLKLHEKWLVGKIMEMVLSANQV